MNINQLFDRDKEGQFKIKMDAFASKTVTINGVTKDLYKRVHGADFNVLSGQTNTCDFLIPYPHVKIEGIEVLNGSMSNSLNLYVLDADGNTYSGLDPQQVGNNVQLNQFAFDVHPRNEYYYHQSQYDADLYQGMLIRVEYTNNGLTDKDIYINFVLNEVK